MKDIASTYLSEFLRLVNEMSPYLLLGFLFAGLLRVIFPRQMVARYMGKRNFRSVFNASLLGVPMPLCSCGVLPAGIGFYRNGASRGSSISFLISTPQTGVDSILATYAMLGLPLAIIRPIVALTTGILGGLLGNATDNSPVESTAKGTTEEDHPRNLKEMFRYGFVELIQDISKWLIIGMLVAALLSVLIPGDFFTSTISSEYLAMLLMLLASVPLYICATGSIPIAAVLLMKGLSPGAALVLLMAGPATNIATMAVIGNTLGKRSLWVYLFTIVGGALFFGILVNELLPREWITGAIPSMIGDHIHDSPAGWFSKVASVVLGLLIVNGYIMKFFSRRREGRRDLLKANAMKDEIQQYRVEGMTCDHCKAKVENGLKELQGVSEVLADRTTGVVSVQADTDNEEDIRKAVGSLGYTYIGKV
ncbi:MAG: heavy metal-associated domain-containing protein [Bacteroidia bacterium]|nr:MAG: heavy metal-associated domain-containing protein [Bacteroidia bacterium]